MTFLLSLLCMAVQAQEIDNPNETIEEDTIFYESFDGMNGKGGNDDDWNISWSINMLSFSTEGTINEGWCNTLTDVRPANKCVCIGTTGNLVSPALTNLKGAAILSFRAGSTKNFHSKLKITIMNAGEFVGQDGSNKMTISLPDKEFGTYSFIIKNCTDKTQISFTNPDAFKALLLDDVKLVNLVSIDENKNNLLTITRYNNKKKDVIIGRTLSPNYWNTICLPFALSQEQIAATFGEGTQVAALESVTSGILGGKKEINFKSVSEMKTGIPYIIKTQEEVSNAIAEDVTIKLISNPFVIKGICQFIGTNSPISLPTKMYVLGENGSLQLADYSNKFYTVPGLQAYFSGVNENYTIKVDGVITDIQTINSDTNKNVSETIYDLNGRKVNSDAKGIVIKNGKKIIIK